MQTDVILNGETVNCYGELMDNSNFEVICEDEMDDGLWAEGNPNNTDTYTFKDWKEVVDVLQEYFDSKIVEITAV